MFSIFSLAFHCLRVCESDPFRTRAGPRCRVASAQRRKTPIRLKTSSPLPTRLIKRLFFLIQLSLKRGLEGRNPIRILIGERAPSVCSGLSVPGTHACVVSRQAVDRRYNGVKWNQGRSGIAWPELKLITSSRVVVSNIRHLRAFCILLFESSLRRQRSAGLMSGPDKHR